MKTEAELNKEVTEDQQTSDLLLSPGSYQVRLVGEMGQSAAREIEMVAGEGRAPLAQNPDQLTGSQMPIDDIVRQEGDTSARQRRFDNQRR